MINPAGIDNDRILASRHAMTLAWLIASVRKSKWGVGKTRMKLETYGQLTLTCGAERTLGGPD